MKTDMKAVRIFFIVMALSGLALGLSDSVFANYFKDAYQIDAFRRGVIEIPREAPGILSLIVISALASFGDVKLAIAAHALSALSLVALGLFTPSFGVMLVFLFINSMGMHMFMPLADGIGLGLAGKDGFGTMLGRYKGLNTAFAMLAGILVFVGFRTGFFSFTAPVKYIFLIAAALLAAIFVLFIIIERIGGDISRSKKAKLVVRREYGIFYILSVLFGARKQIMYVYAPWVLIDLLGFGADRMALLAIAGAGIGVLFIPAVGRWIDRYGPARIMTIEAACFLAIYVAYGALSAGLNNGTLAAAGMTVAIAFVLNIFDKMTMHFNMVKTVYMRRIAVDFDDVTPTLSLGMCLDHILSILSAVLCGWLWNAFGPQYVFVFAGALSAANMAVARYCAHKPNPAFL